MKDSPTSSTEAAIMAAAESEFLENGYASTKTTDIAQRAGVTHAMLHYYFRTKENLFELVFKTKMESLANSLILSFDQDLPFDEKIRQGVEQHFDFIAANPQMPWFLMREVMHNKAHRDSLLKVMRPKAQSIMRKLGEDLEAEADAGRVCRTEPLDLMLNIIQLNVFPFLATPLITELLGGKKARLKKFMQHRKQENVRLILAQLRPEI
jgi:AcrR family transcriptional regulator